VQQGVKTDKKDPSARPGPTNHSGSVAAQRAGDREQLQQRRLGQAQRDCVDDRSTVTNRTRQGEMLTLAMKASSSAVERSGPDAARLDPRPHRFETARRESERAAALHRPTCRAVFMPPRTGMGLFVGHALDMRIKRAHAAGISARAEIALGLTRYLIAA
jgi:hypothetical protein